MEILSPVKNLQAAKVVVGAGADAIYFASPNFGARTKAAIDVAEAKEIISYCKRNKVLTYATFNTVIFDDELEQFFNELDLLYQAGLDAVIIQDFSFINLIKQYYPELDVHASTQMHVHNSYATKYAQAEGSNRIVVPREMSFKRIRAIKDNTNVEIEAFVHGALCVSYSGQCYDSTLLDQKSANRGRCSQYCRMPQYTVFEPTGKIVSNGDYPLNLKDQNNIENTEAYKRAGVDSLKIEGRLKSIDYAYLTTKAYREKLDNNQIIDLQNVYNREFTTGRISGLNGRDIVNLYRPNNSGKKIGVVTKVEINSAKSLKYYDYVITIKLEQDTKVNIHDNIRFVAEDFEDGQVVEQFKQLTTNTILLFSKIKPEVEDEVYRTLNNQILDSAKKAVAIVRREQVNINLFLKNANLFYVIEGHKPVNTNIIFEKAQNKPTTKEEIIEKLKKTKNTNFDLNVVDFKYDDDMFCQISKINQLKKNIIKTLNTDSEIRFSNTVDLPDKILSNDETTNTYYVEVQTKEQYDTVVSKFDDAVILIANIELAKEINPRESDYVVTPSVLYDDEQDEVFKVCEKFDNLVVSELGAFARFKNTKNIITNYTFNTTNYVNQQKLISEGAYKTLVSIELNEEKIRGFGNDSTIVNIYGRIPVMTMDYCPINMKKTDSCGPCRKCRLGEYQLEDKLGRIFPLFYAGNDRIAMLSRKPISLLASQDGLNKNNIRNFHIRFTIEDHYDVSEVIDCIITKSNQLSFDVNSGSYFKTTL